MNTSPLAGPLTQYPTTKSPLEGLTRAGEGLYANVAYGLDAANLQAAKESELTKALQQGVDIGRIGDAYLTGKFQSFDDYIAKAPQLAQQFGTYASDPTKYSVIDASKFSALPGFSDLKPLSGLEGFNYQVYNAPDLTGFLSNWAPIDVASMPQNQWLTKEATKRAVQSGDAYYLNKSDLDYLKDPFKDVTFIDTRNAANLLPGWEEDPTYAYWARNKYTNPTTGQTIKPFDAYAGNAQGANYTVGNYTDATALGGFPLLDVGYNLTSTTPGDLAEAAYFMPFDWMQPGGRMGGDNWDYYDWSGSIVPNMSKLAPEYGYVTTVNDQRGVVLPSWQDYTDWVKASGGDTQGTTVVSPSHHWGDSGDGGLFGGLIDAIAPVLPILNFIPGINAFTIPISAGLSIGAGISSGNLAQIASGVLGASGAMGYNPFGGIAEGLGNVAANIPGLEFLSSDFVGPLTSGQGAIADALKGAVTGGVVGGLGAGAVGGDVLSGLLKGGLAGGAGSGIGSYTGSMDLGGEGSLLDMFAPQATAQIAKDYVLSGGANVGSILTGAGATVLGNLAASQTYDMLKTKPEYDETANAFRIGDITYDASGAPVGFYNDGKYTTYASVAANAGESYSPSSVGSLNQLAALEDSSARAFAQAAGAGVAQLLKTGDVGAAILSALPYAASGAVDELFGALGIAGGSVEKVTQGLVSAGVKAEQAEQLAQKALDARKEAYAQGVQKQNKSLSAEDKSLSAEESAAVADETDPAKRADLLEKLRSQANARAAQAIQRQRESRSRHAQELLSMGQGLLNQTYSQPQGGWSLLEGSPVALTGGAGEGDLSAIAAEAAGMGLTIDEYLAQLSQLRR